MARIVMKFGGTSVANIDRIRAAADRVKRARDAGHEVAVVVSAMAGVTNQLAAWAGEIGQLSGAQSFDVAADAAGRASAETQRPGGEFGARSFDVAADAAGRESDVVVATGEQVTCGLMALALQALGLKSRSWLAWQLPIVSDDAHGKARIESIEAKDLLAALAQGEVPVVPGFQGVTRGGRVTTLGRGGSDTSAVALAATLKADRCDIHTDVDGVYTSDPRVVAKARKLDKITYEEMLEMASVGAKVLQTRSVELAMKQGVRLQVLSSFNDVPGTLVVDEDEIVEKALVSGVAYSRDEAKITLSRVADRPGVAAAVFGPLADANVNVDMIVQNVSADGKTTDLTFTVVKADLDRAVAILEARRKDLGFAGLIQDRNVVKVSVIGVGMRSHAGVAQRMFKTLAEKGINIQAITTSEIKVSVLIAEEYTELAVRALHSAYGLDAE